MGNGATVILDVSQLMRHGSYNFKYIFMLLTLCYSISDLILVTEMSHLNVLNVTFKCF